MRGGMFGEDAVAGAPAHAGTFRVRQAPQDADHFQIVRREQDLLARSKEFLKARPRVGEDGSAACGGFKETDGGGITGMDHVVARQV